MDKRWYVVHAYSGFEKSVQRNLLDRIQRAGMQDKFGEILVPVEEVIEMKSGQKSISERKFFPGYLLVQMDMTDESWHLVKSTPKVTGFVGGTSITRTASPTSNNTFGFGFSTPSCTCCRMFCTSFSLMGVGLVEVPPTNPVTLGVLLTRCQLSSVMSICTSK